MDGGGLGHLEISFRAGHERLVPQVTTKVTGCGDGPQSPRRDVDANGAPRGQDVPVRQRPVNRTGAPWRVAACTWTTPFLVGVGSWAARIPALSPGDDLGSRPRKRH